MKGNGTGWKHPGMRSSDYGHGHYHDHDRRAYGKGPKGYKRKDESIREEVSELLYWHPDVDASQLEVLVEEGIVYLRGFVDSRHAKHMAEDIIENVSGVQDIQNRLSIKQHFDIESDKIVTRGDDGLFTQETIQR